MVVVRNAADYDAVRALATKDGARVVSDMRQINGMVVYATTSIRDALAGDSRLVGVAADHVEQVAQAERPPVQLRAPGVKNHTTVSVPGKPAGTPGTFQPDPAFSLDGLMWDQWRAQATGAWGVTTGSSSVTVGVADTGLDYMHPELATKVESVVDFTVDEDPPLCKTFFGTSDEELAATYGGPVDTDWNGHGSWIGGNIAAAADGQGINGIAPGVGLVSLKISQWCGSAYDSTLIEAFLYAADHGIDVVSISFGGYLDRSDPSQDLIYQQYRQAVRYGKNRGTLIVAAAGNEHTRVGAGGRVLSHGILTVPGDPLTDYFGWWETPGGIPGVVDVSATNNLVNGSSDSCPVGTLGGPGGNATCKPLTDAHQQAGPGLTDQLTYYSNYGPRIDIAAPGGGRKFNVPKADRGGTPGFPVTKSDGTNVWEDFSITSNWATQIPCYYLLGRGFYENNCYTSIQGTSMATPHVSAVAALIVSAHPELQGDVDGIIAQLKATATAVHNMTQPLSATDTSGGDWFGGTCDTGYCHLGGSAISDAEAYGAGLVNAAAAVS
jgi:lantibiotic leader peptide-processing serine protease